MENSDPVESVADFEARARRWVRSNMPPANEDTDRTFGRTRADEEELARLERCRELQRMLFDGGFSGICVPREYGGQGLTPDHQRALIRALEGFDYPGDTQSPTFAPCLGVILDFANDEQKRRHVPPMLRGETLWVQLLSEPSGGSDVASAQMTAVRDGDEWVLNGSKIWTTGASWAQWGLCLARTNWDVPKHRGLTVFMVPLDAPGIEIQDIEMLNGQRTFSQVYMTDVRVSDAERIGEVNEGWTVGVRWMYHERTVAGGSPYVTRPPGTRSASGSTVPRRLLRRMEAAGHADDRRSRALIGEVHALGLVGSAITRRIGDAIRSGAVSDQSAAIVRLFLGTSSVRTTSVEFELAGASAVAWSEEHDDPFQAGISYLMRQAACIGGGTTEMARNVISERVLGMPRELSGDKDRPFREVPRGPSSG